jgi:hypothetical protein
MPLEPFLALILFLPAVIIIGNFVIATLTPITWSPDDDMSLIDPVWRLVQGQHFGTDFHDPRGFGLFHMAAMLWRLLGPQYYVLRAAVDLFAFVIILCGCVVATRRLHPKAALAALFCITVAFTASGPSNNGSHDFGMALTYNRLITAGFAVLFVQSFAKDSDFQRDRDYIDLFTAAFLLNILFLVKISGLVLGLAIVAGGLIVRVRLTRGLVDFLLILLFLAIMVAIDFVITGTSLFPVIHDYRLAAQARIGSYSVLDALYFASRWPILWVVALMALYAVSQPDREGSGNLWCCFFIIAFYWACQVLLNMSNWGPSRSLIHLAPAAIVAVVTWTDTSGSGAFWDHLCSRFYPRRLREIPAREVIPLLILALVLAPEALASFRAVKLDYSISSGTVKPTAMTASKGIRFEIYGAGLSGFVFSVTRAVQAGLGASRETIVNLDSTNPFPSLFLAPSPKGVSVFWDFGYNVPFGYEPSWQEVIGDACLVTEPKYPWPSPPNSKRLIAAVQSHLVSAFNLVYQDELWKIWKHSGGCDATDGAGPIAAEKQPRMR